MVRHGLALVLVVCLGSATGLAEELADGPLSVEETADVAVVLARTRSAAMLRTLAVKEEPDPWRVAEELCRRGEAKAASLFATAAPRRDVDALAAYVTARAGKDLSSARAAMDEARRALEAGDVTRALDALEGPARQAEDVPAVAAAFGRGELLAGLRRWKESHEAFLAAAQAARRLGWIRLAATAFHRAGHAAFERADLRLALRAWTWRLEVERNRGIGIAAAEALGNIALLHKRRGDFAKAIANAKQALEGMEEAEHGAGVAKTLANLGTMYRGIGDYPRALSHQERAHRLFLRLEMPREAALSLANQGNLHADLGNGEKALALLRQGRALLQETGDTQEVVRLSVSIAAVERSLGSDTQSVAHLTETLRAAAAADDRRLMMTILGNLGDAHGDAGRAQAALASHEEARKLADELGDRAAAARELVKTASWNAQLGRREQAVEQLTQAIRDAESLRAQRTLVSALTALAWIHRGEERPELALAAAKRAAPDVEVLVRGQEDEGGARARAQYADLYAVGALAAADVGDEAEVCYFLETGRAGALLESLEQRDALRSSQLPEELLEAELRALSRLKEAMDELGRVRAGGSLEETRAARAPVDEARAAVSAVHDRIQRHEKRVANLFYPRAATAEEIRRALRPDEAFVSYALLPNDSLVLVLTRADQRVVPLGRTETIEALCQELDATRAGRDVGEAVDRLRKALVEPLELDAQVRRVLISPDGALSYVPFVLLLPDRDLTCAPSATTWKLLRDEVTPRGEGVLALGDPDYRTHADKGAMALYSRGLPLPALPASRNEVEQIGDVKLLGPHATKAGLLEALKKRRRWRAVHLACHGLIDPQRPRLSSLALSAAPGDPGFLTVSEVFRLEVPADLVVLSACETGRGRVFQAEGIVGMTRAFMYAGTPRVLVSLWNVDDDATRALMVKFYELWKGDTPPATALRGAQAHVRAQAKWKHPYFWAAWVLWGLP